MKRIKAIVFSWAMLMAFIMVANVSWAARGDDPTIEGAIISNGGGLVEPKPGYDLAVNCPVYDARGNRIGTSNMNFDLDESGKLVSSLYRITLNDRFGSTLTVNDMSVLEAPFEGIFTCLCRGDATGTGAFANVKSVQCNCAFDYEVNELGEMTKLSCKYCTCVLFNIPFSG